MVAIAAVRGIVIVVVVVSIAVVVIACGKINVSVNIHKVDGVEVDVVSEVDWTCIGSVDCC